jgi:carbon monoxide dehydrogenase subunit G
MAMEISKTFVVKASPDAVWSFLTDIQRVAHCLPGAAIGEKLDEKTFPGTMTVKVGPVSSTYRGKVVFERLDPTARTAEIVASGQDVRGKGGADLRLTSSVKARPGGETEVTAVSQVNVTGILAQMGRGMIQDVSDEMFQVFSERMRAELESAPARTTAASSTGAPGTTAPATGTPGPGSPAPSIPAAGTPAPGTAASASSAGNEVALDVVALGARAARRTAGRWVREPGFWAVVAIAVAVALYAVLHRSS